MNLLSVESLRKLTFHSSNLLLSLVKSNLRQKGGCLGVLINSLLLPVSVIYGFLFSCYDHVVVASLIICRAIKKKEIRDPFVFNICADSKFLNR